MKNIKFKAISFMTAILDRYIENTEVKDYHFDMEELREAKKEIKANPELINEYINNIIADMKKAKLSAGLCPDCENELQSRITHHGTETTPPEYEVYCSCGYKED